MISYNNVDVFERRKGHGWKRKVVGRYTFKGVDWVYYVQDFGNGYGCERFACTLSAMKRWGRLL